MRAVGNEPPFEAQAESASNQPGEPRQYITVYGGGSEAAYVQLGTNLNPGPGGIRGDVGGWSKDSARRNSEFLFSIREDVLAEHLSLWVTLTVRDCPATAADWHRRRRALYDYLRHNGMKWWHWLTEWQRRGVPHLHTLIVLEGNQALYHMQARNGLVNEWLRINADLGVSTRAQRVSLVNYPAGIKLYQAKHGVRGLRHYQRAPENIPDGWRGRTGRLWGASRDFPVQPPRRWRLSGAEFERARRNLADQAFRELLAKGLLKPEDYSDHMADAEQRLSAAKIVMGQRDLGDLFEGIASPPSMP